MMNSLSWFIYLADIVNAIDGVFITVFIFAVISAVVSGIVSAISYAEREKEERAAANRVFRWTMPIAIISGLVSIAVPSQRTVLMIATSEFGEELSETETASKAQKALDKFLSDYLEDDD